MKLPGIEYKTAVQSLGRRDVNAPIRVANAEAGAISQWGEVGKDLYDIIEQDRTDQANSDFIDKIGEFKKAYGTKKWFAPDEIPNDLGIDTEGRDRIPAYEAYPRMYDAFMKQTMEESSMKTLPGPSRDRYLEAKSDRINQESAQTQINASQVAHAAIKKDQKDRIDLAMDEKKYGKAIALINTYTGTDAERATEVMRVAKGMDNDSYSSYIMLSNTHTEIDRVEEYALAGKIVDADGTVRSTVLNSDEMWAIRNKIESRRTEFGKERTRRQEAVVQGDVVELLAGTLTENTISEQVATDKISSTQGLTLREKLKTGANRIGESNKASLGFFKQQIRNIRYMRDSDELVSEKAENIKARLRYAASGMDEGGYNTGDPSINGNDYDTLLDVLEKEVNLHTKQPEYKNAKKSISTFTGLDQFDVNMESIMDESPAIVRAYLDFQTELDDYMDRMGDEADPMAYVREVQDRFSPAHYIEGETAKFVKSYPAYAKPETGESKFYTNGVLDTDKVKEDVFKRFSNNDLTMDEARLAVERFSPEGLMTINVRELIELSRSGSRW